jgi:hypothetical protein
MIKTKEGFVETNEQLIGWKVISTIEENQHDVFKGQTENDWSAIYIQFSKQHALRYLSTKYEQFLNVSLSKFVFDEKIKFLKIDDDWMFDEKLSSLEKAKKIKQYIIQNELFNINPENPLMKELGKFKCCLITFDTEFNQEMVVPHLLLEDDSLIQYKVDCKFYRNGNNFLKTDKVEDSFGVEIKLTKDQKNYTEELIKILY